MVDDDLDDSFDWPLLGVETMSMVSEEPDDDDDEEEDEDDEDDEDDDDEDEADDDEEFEPAEDSQFANTPESEDEPMADDSALVARTSIRPILPAVSRCGAAGSVPPATPFSSAARPFPPFVELASCSSSSPSL
jgi:hypothetical protein